MSLSRRNFFLSASAILALPLIAAPAFAKARKKPSKKGKGKSKSRAKAKAKAVYVNPNDASFEKLSKDWLKAYFEMSPVAATQIGFHGFDNIIDDLSRQGFKNNAAKARSLQTRLEAIDFAALSKDNKVDYLMLQNSLKETIFDIEELQSFTWNTLIYSATAGQSIYGLMAREFAPIEVRLGNVIKRLEQLPKIFAAARSNLNPLKVPPIYAQTYSRQNAGLQSLLNDTVMKYVSNLTALEVARLDWASNTFFTELANHQEWIDSVLVPNAKGDFRLGAALFDKKLSHTLMSPLSRQEIKNRAWAKIKEVRASMYETAKIALSGKNHSLDLPKIPSPAQEQAAIAAALAMAAEQRPPRDSMIEMAKDQVKFATEFVAERDLISLPKGPVEVIEVPEFQQGFSTAYCDSPGPLEKNLATFYAVSPIPKSWSEEEVKSYLSEYNVYGLLDISVHEAMPGHYVQLFHANSCKSTLRAVLGSGSFIEGWAVYAENMMVEQGFMGEDPLYKLSQHKILLRTITNSLIDQAIHVENMGREEFMKLLTETAFQEEKEASEKWVRAQLSATQLSTYFVGFVEHYEAREAAKAKFGSSFDLKKYNDGILSFGSPPVRLARAMLLSEEIA